jgi:hypothetical protein
VNPSNDELCISRSGTGCDRGWQEGKIAGHKSLVASKLEKASDLAVANLYYYFFIIK